MTNKYHSDERPENWKANDQRVPEITPWFGWGSCSSVLSFPCCILWLLSVFKSFFSHFAIADFLSLSISICVMYIVIYIFWQQPFWANYCFSGVCSFTTNFVFQMYQLRQYQELICANLPVLISIINIYDYNIFILFLA